MRAKRSASVELRKASPLLLGAIGVLCFSMTFPATTAAERAFGPVLVGVGRAVPAAVLGAGVLLARRQPLLPPRPILARMLIVAAPVGIGFGLLSALALRHVSSVHGAVLTGLIPAATAGIAVLRAGERPRASYWVALGLGLVVVVSFAVVQGGGTLRPADLILLAAIVVAGFGYTEGGVLAREYGGWRIICWALILALPASVPVTAWAAVTEPVGHVTAAAVAGLAWVSVISMLLGFFAWYQGLARGGVARVGRLQLAQPALTMVWAALLLGEHVSWLTGAAAAAVIAVTAVGRNARVDRAGSPGPDPVSAGGPAVDRPAADRSAADRPAVAGLTASSPAAASPVTAGPAAGPPGPLAACPGVPGGASTAAAVASWEA
jgi:drug/metabolite transporter (DMT)-like permease